MYIVLLISACVVAVPIACVLVYRLLKSCIFGAAEYFEVCVKAFWRSLIDRRATRPTNDVVIEQTDGIVVQQNVQETQRSQTTSKQAFELLQFNYVLLKKVEHSNYKIVVCLLFVYSFFLNYVWHPVINKGFLYSSEKLYYFCGLFGDTYCNSLTKYTIYKTPSICLCSLLLFILTAYLENRQTLLAEVISYVEGLSTVLIRCARSSNIDAKYERMLFKVFYKKSYGFTQCFIILTAPIETLIYAIESPDL